MRKEKQIPDNRMLSCALIYLEYIIFDIDMPGNEKEF